MKNYRITKYNPEYRNEKGYYTANDWTSLSDIGNTYLEKTFTIGEYIEIEKAYCDVIAKILFNNHIDNFNVIEIEKYNSLWKVKRLLRRYKIYLSEEECSIIKKIENNTAINCKDAITCIKLMLRGCFWAMLESPEPVMRLSVGQDYYVYMSCEEIPPYIINISAINGIYIEEIVNFPW